MGADPDHDLVMPTYVYETIPADGSAPVTFEVQQKMADAPLTAHPETGVPARRVMTAANLGGFAGGASRAAERCETPAAAGCGMGACGMGGCGGGGWD